MIYPLPVFSEFKVASNGVSGIEGEELIFFTLINGVDSIECEMRAKRKVEKFEVYNDGDVQNCVDREFEYLEVDCETGVNVDLDYVQKIKLTEKQAYDLNEYLKDEMKMVGVV